MLQTLSDALLVAVRNTGGSINIINTAGIVVTVSNTATNINIINSAGWIVSVSNTGGSVSLNNSKSIKSITGTISATSSVVAAISNKRVKVCAYSLITSSQTAVTVLMNGGSSGTALWTVPLQSIASTYFGANLAVTAPSFIFATATNTLLEMNLSSANPVTYSISYFDDDTT